MSASTPELAVRSLAWCDTRRLHGAGEKTRTWAELGVNPRARRLRSGPLTRSPWPTFRRLDRFAQMAGLLAERLDVARTLDADARADTALVLGSASGCLAADLRWAASLSRREGVEPAVFPYTLPSTALGELAIRHGLRGPTLTLSLDPADARPLLEETARLLHGDELPAALVVLGDWLPDGAADTPAAARLAALLVERGPAREDDAARWQALLREPDVLRTITRTIR